MANPSSVKGDLHLGRKESLIKDIQDNIVADRIKEQMAPTVAFDEALKGICNAEWLKELVGTPYRVFLHHLNEGKLLVYERDGEQSTKDPFTLDIAKELKFSGIPEDKSSWLLDLIEYTIWHRSIKWTKTDNRPINIISQYFDKINQEERTEAFFLTMDENCGAIKQHGAVKGYVIVNDIDEEGNQWVTLTTMCGETKRYISYRHCMWDMYKQVTMQPVGVPEGTTF